MITVDDLAESNVCPCEVCSSQDGTLTTYHKKQVPYTGKLVNKNSSTLIRIDSGIHKLLKIKAATENTTIRTLVEGALSDLLAVNEARNG